MRPAAVAGLFYPKDPRDLAQTVDRLLQDASLARGEARVGRVKGVIAPHAGYVYSGPIAATAYDRLRAGSDREKVRRVVLMGPTHRAYVRGLALAGVEAFETPLGRIPVDLEAVALVSSLPQVVTSPAAHAREHSLEVHLPFLQRLFGTDFALVPFAVGEATPEEVAEVLDRLWGGDDTRVVISSDLSHFLSYRDAFRVDSETAKHILALDPVDGDHACGARPLNGLLALARRRQVRLELLDLRSSGDTAGTRDEVVGYGAFLLREGEPGGAS
ncbi:MAG: AmmeMemoRadiSam system protein B [Sandaracinus sp.]